MVKGLVKIIFGRKISICQLISNFFVALFKTFGCKRMIRSHFAVGVSEQTDMQKGSFQRMMYGEKYKSLRKHAHAIYCNISQM